MQSKQPLGTNKQQNLIDHKKNIGDQNRGQN